MGLFGNNFPWNIEQEISKEIISKCVSKDQPTILEIGCNDGTNTAWFLEIFNNPRIYCFEPEPRAIERFRTKIGKQENVYLFDIALSDRDGEVTFYQSSGENKKVNISLPQGWDFSGSIKKPKNHLKVHPWVKFESEIKVKTAMLDSWCEQQQIELIDFIWMDVQGAELDVLKGGINSLNKVRYIYTEYSNQELYENQASLSKLLKQLPTFEIVKKYPNDVLLKNKNID